MPRFRYTYVDRTRRTKTGKLRAAAGTSESQGRFGTDWTIFQIKGLSKSAKKVYRYLSAIADQDGYCFPFHKTVASRTNLAESTEAKALKELEESGLVSREQRVSRRGGSSNLYHVKKVSQPQSEETGGHNG